MLDGNILGGHLVLTVAFGLVLAVLLYSNVFRGD